MRTSYTKENVFTAATQSADVWIRDLKGILDVDDAHDAYEAFRAVLHALRERLTVAESSEFASGLLLIMRGIYFEGWRPEQSSRPLRRTSEFFRSVQAHHEGLAAVDAETMTEAVFIVLNRNVKEPAVTRMKRVLPEPLRELWPPVPGLP